MDPRDEIAAGGLVLPHMKVRLMSDTEIVASSGGLVRKLETINYRTFAPEKDGLFCVRIFGEIRACECGKEPAVAMRQRDMKAGRVCSACNARVHLAPDRRRRFGHIALGAPVVHPWFAEQVARAASLETKDFEAILFFEKYLVVAGGVSHPRGSTVSEEVLYTLLEGGTPGTAFAQGAEAIEQLLGAPHPAILRTIPVLPPHLRPLDPLGGSRFSTTDVNDLYRRVINRNNRLVRLLEFNAPEVIIRSEKRMLQEAVISLYDNERADRVVRGPNRIPLRSIAATTGDPRRLDRLFAEIDAELASGRASLARPRRQHRRLAALRAAALAIDSAPSAVRPPSL